MTKTTKPAGKKAAPGKPKRQQTDWDAIEAAHRTGRYTDGQLAALFKVSRESIVRRRKQDQAKDSRRWAKDLSEQVRETTQALLAQDAVAKAAAERHTEVTASVTDVTLVNAEVAKQVILRHRRDISALNNLAQTLLSEVSLQTVQPEVLVDLHEKITEDMDEGLRNLARKALRDALAVGGRVSSIHKLADTMAKVQALERKAFSLDDPGEKPPKGSDIDPANVTRDTAIDAYRQMVHG